MSGPDTSCPFPESFPIELYGAILAYLPLQSLIFARGVCTLWRDAVLAAPLTPARRALLALFDRLLASPSFLASHAHMNTVIAACDRENVIASIAAEMSGGRLPDEFVTWVLEWPGRCLVNNVPWIHVRHRHKDITSFRCLREGTADTPKLGEDIDEWEPDYDPEAQCVNFHALTVEFLPSGERAMLIFNVQEDAKGLEGSVHLCDSTGALSTWGEPDHDHPWNCAAKSWIGWLEMQVPRT
jgi:hypothetical protein